MVAVKSTKTVAVETKKMKYQMIISDYDGTTAIGNKIPSEVVNAIKNYQSRGGKFVFCTGRAEASISKVIEENAIVVDAVISYQGSKVTVDNVPIIKGGIDKETALSLIDDMRSYNKGIVVFFNDEIYYEGHDGVYRYVDFYKSLVKATEVADLRKFVEDNDSAYQKLVITKTPEEDLSEIESFISEKYRGRVIANSGGVRLLEFVATDYTKHAASKRVAEYFNVSSDSVITVGDSSNDLTLLEFGFGIAVENATDKLKQTAKFIAPHVDKFPLKFIIDKVLSGEDFT